MLEKIDSSAKKLIFVPVLAGQLNFVSNGSFSSSLASVTLAFAFPFWYSWKNTFPPRLTSALK